MDPRNDTRRRTALGGWLTVTAGAPAAAVRRARASNTDQTRAWYAVAAAVVVLSLHNVAVHTSTSPVLDVAWIALTSVLLVMVGRVAGLASTDVGIDRAQLRRGLGPSLRIAGLVVVAILVAAAVPATRDLIADARFVGVDVGTAVRRAVVDIPIYVAFEEFAFRGLLLALLLRVLPTRGAVLASSVLFGVWHVLPTIDQVGAGLGQTSLGVALAMGAGIVVVTGVAGLAFSWLRLRGDSLLLPIALHGAVNVGAHLVGWTLVAAHL